MCILCPDEPGPVNNQLQNGVGVTRYYSVCMICMSDLYVWSDSGRRENHCLQLWYQWAQHDFNGQFQTHDYTDALVKLCGSQNKMNRRNERYFYGGHGVDQGWGIKVVSRYAYRCKSKKKKKLIKIKQTKERKRRY